jgi:hypothetical protein
MIRHQAGQERHVGGELLGIATRRRDRDTRIWSPLHHDRHRPEVEDISPMFGPWLTPGRGSGRSGMSAPTASSTQSVGCHPWKDPCGRRTGEGAGAV